MFEGEQETVAKNPIKYTKKILIMYYRICRPFIMKQIKLLAIFSVFITTSAISQELSQSDIQLLIAAYDGDSVEVKSLIEKGANVNAVTAEGVTPLMLACQNGYTGIAAELIRSGAQINSRADGGLTALILSIKAGNIETAEYLIRNNANANLSDDKGVSPLMHAIQVDSFYLPDMLIYYGADINQKDNNGTDALMLSSFYGSFEIVFNLLEAGADINATDQNGNTPLHYATSAGNTDIMELLILNGAEVDRKNNSGFSPLSLAVSLDRYKEALLLTGAGADVNSRIRSSLNPLGIAISNNNDSLVRLLRNHDAELLRRPDFNVFSAGAGLTFNQDDSRINFLFGLNDRRFYWMPSIGYSFRPSAVKVLEEVDSSTFFQYNEQRHFASMGLSRAFFIRRYNRGFTTAAYAGIAGTLTFGSYIGSSEGPDARFLFNPSAGCMFEFGFLRLKVGYEFLDLHLSSYSSHWLSVSLEFLLNTKKRNILP